MEPHDEILQHVSFAALLGGGGVSLLTAVYSPGLPTWPPNWSGRGRGRRCAGRGDLGREARAEERRPHPVRCAQPPRRHLLLRPLHAGRTGSAFAGPGDPLGGLEVACMLAVGQSQSAFAPPPTPTGSSRSPARSTVCCSVAPAQRHRSGSPRPAST